MGMKMGKKGKIKSESTDTTSDTAVVNPGWLEQIPLAENVDEVPVENTETTGNYPIPEAPPDFDCPPPPDFDCPPTDVEAEVEVDICIRDQDYSDSSRMTRTPIPSLDNFMPPAEEIVPQCAYLTPLVEISIGTPPRQSIYIHKGILEQSSILESQCNNQGYYFDDSAGINTKVALPETDIEVFTLVMTYLYTGNYKNLASPTSPQKWDEYSDLESLHKHIQLYSFGRTYNIEGLSRLASQNIEGLENRPKFQSLLQIAQEIYEGLPDDETWFTGYVKTAFGKAVGDDPKILGEEWLSETIKCGGKLAVDLLPTLSSTVNTAFEGSTGFGSADHSVPISESEIVTCPFKNEHLAKLSKKGLWKDCEACKRERSRLLSLGSIIMSLAIEEHIPTLYINDGGNGTFDTTSLVENDINNIMKPKKKKNKLRKKWRSLCQQPHIRLILSTLSEVGQFSEEVNSELCPNHKDHLKFVGGKWAWEDCPDCLNDREVIFRKIKNLDLPEQLRDLIPQDSSQLKTTESKQDDQDSHEVVTEYNSDAPSIREHVTENESEVVSLIVEG